MTRADARFSRVEPRRRARAFVLGLLAELPRKNCWTIAGHAGDRTPDGMQHLLSRARWDAGGVRDDVRSYVVEQLGDPGAVLVADETGDVKKGAATPGVQRQYTGTAGRIENARVAVYLSYASPHEELREQLCATTGTAASRPLTRSSRSWADASSGQNRVSELARGAGDRASGEQKTKTRPPVGGLPGGGPARVLPSQVYDVGTRCVMITSSVPEPGPLLVPDGWPVS